MSTQVGPDAGVFSVFVDGQGVNVDGFRANSDCVINWVVVRSPEPAALRHGAVQGRVCELERWIDQGLRTAASLNFGHFHVSAQTLFQGAQTFLSDAPVLF